MTAESQSTHVMRRWGLHNEPALSYDAPGSGSCNADVAVPKESGGVCGLNTLNSIAFEHHVQHCDKTCTSDHAPMPATMHATEDVPHFVTVRVVGHLISSIPAAVQKYCFVDESKSVTRRTIQRPNYTTNIRRLLR